ncbi:hypothetical protein EVAR_2856_1 [Eumeta japonica]|uniref:Uncharacterized protein n=1 Tax=Eumeta variegata TaxID=151549 RepID=A0A4C1T3K6_EUMVA|nr:hypothetical protein EVAR_2856_1 [Eumeta japonica]
MDRELGTSSSPLRFPSRGLRDANPDGTTGEQHCVLMVKAIVWILIVRERSTAPYSTPIDYDVGGKGRKLSEPLISSSDRALPVIVHSFNAPPLEKVVCENSHHFTSDPLINSGLIQEYRFRACVKGVREAILLLASATSATADGLAPEGASQTKKFCLQVIKKRPRKKFCLQVIKKRPRKPDVADVHEWCSAATV